MENDRTTPELFHESLDCELAGGVDEAALALAGAARETRLRRNQPCESVIARDRVACVLSGAVRKFALRANGQRQIVDLLIPGDFLGLAPSDPAFLLEAVCNDTRVASFSRDRIDALAVRYAKIATLVRKGTVEAIHRLEHHRLVQGRITAREKVGAYLAAMSRRLTRGGDSALVLPITRYDIADHLGIAVETVSRTMTQLRRRGSIALRTPRAVEIRDPAILSDGLC
jgi:CRP/FNR family nitrogen fixation transcriptional regulator